MAQEVKSQKRKLWLRLGGSIEATEEEYEEIVNGTVKGAEILRQKVLDNNFRLDGNTYIPVTAPSYEGWPVSEEVDYDF